MLLLVEMEYMFTKDYHIEVRISVIWEYCLFQCASVYYRKTVWYASKMKLKAASRNHLEDLS